MTAIGERSHVNIGDVGAQRVAPLHHPPRLPPFLIFVVALALSMGLMSVSAMIMGQTLPSTGTVTFERLNRGYLDLYLIDIDRGTLHNLTHSPLNDEAGAWSPDHRRLAFVSLRDGQRHLYLFTLGEAGSPRRLTYGRIAAGGKPAWSPDGRFLAYEVEYRSGIDLYLIDVDAPVQPNLNPRALTDGVTDSRYPVWSPDGSRLAFVSWSDGNAEIYTVDPETMQFANLTRNGDWDFSPAWSPDGSQIAFYSDRNLFLRELYLMDADGGNLRRLTNDALPQNTIFASTPVWSPDGSQIAYLVAYNTNVEIEVINVETGYRRRLTNNYALDTRLVWLPDGQGMVFMSDRGGYWGVYQMDITGENTRHLATFAADRGTLSLWGR
jgi:TolB protein